MHVRGGPPGRMALLPRTHLDVQCHALQDLMVLRQGCDECPHAAPCPTWMCSVMRCRISWYCGRAVMSARMLPSPISLSFTPPAPAALAALFLDWNSLKRVAMAAYTSAMNMWRSCKEEGGSQGQ